MIPADVAKFNFLYNTSGCFNSFVIQQLWWLLLTVLLWSTEQSYYSPPSQLGFFDFVPPCTVDFDKKIFMPSGTNLYYHLTKQFHDCLNSLAMFFQLQNMFWKNINCFWLWWKTHTKHCTSNYVISHVKRLSSLHVVVVQVLSISGYDLENRTWWWKSWFWFCSVFVYFADWETSYFASCLCCSYKFFQLYRLLGDGFRSF